MKKSLLFGLAAASVLGMQAVTEPAVTSHRVADDGSLKSSYVNIKSEKTLSRLAKGVAVKAHGNGDRLLKRLHNAGADKKINPYYKRTIKAAAAEGVSFFESFENWDGQTLNWFPEGWTMESKGDAGLDAISKWGTDHVDTATGFPEAADGDCVAVICFSLDALEQDEWLITPEITVKENEQLSFFYYANPIFLFDTDKIDWDEYEFTERVIICDLQVFASVDGGEWTELWKLTDNYADMSAYEIMLNTPTSMLKQNVRLSDYVGKNVRIAFRYVGKNGDTMTLDAVSVGLPSLDGVYYNAPYETLYWGFDRQPGWGKLGLKVAQYPVLSPITWNNATYNDEAQYSWLYHHPEINDMVESDEQDALTVTYRPDYTSAFTSRNNMYYPPVLNASAPGAIPGSYVAPYDYFQTGGKPEIELTDNGGTKVLWSTGLLPFEHNTDGFTFMTIDDETIGDMALPVFGYNSNVDKYWLNYTMNGEEPSEGDDVYVSAIMNYLFPSTGKMVLEGVHVLGLGQVPESASIEFKMEIVKLVEGVPDMESPLASAVCSADKLIRSDYGVNQMLTIPFDFGTPIVIDDSEEGYMVKFSGFHNKDITYFVPLQSELPHRDYLCHGWLVKQIRVLSEDYRESYSPMYYVEGEHGPCINGFAMNLCGYYPWLECDTESVSLPEDGSPVSVKLSSYYDGSELKLSEVAGLEATVEGRYGDCVLTLKHDDTAVVVDGELSIEAPGVKVVVAVKGNSGGVDSIEADKSAEPVEGFTPDGRRVDLKSPHSGIVIVRYSDGSVRKQTVK